MHEALCWIEVAQSAEQTPTINDIYAVLIKQRNHHAATVTAHLNYPEKLGEDGRNWKRNGPAKRSTLVRGKKLKFNHVCFIWTNLFLLYLFFWRMKTVLHL